MTVCSGVLTHARHTQAAVPIRDSASSAFFKFNFILALLMLAMLAGYIFLSNFLVSQKYILGLRKQQFNQLSTGLPSEGTAESSYGLDDLLLFAQRSGMTEAKDIGMILEESGVALSSQCRNCPSIEIPRLWQGP